MRDFNLKSYLNFVGKAPFFRGDCDILEDNTQLVEMRLSRKGPVFQRGLRQEMVYMYFDDYREVVGKAPFFRGDCDSPEAVIRVAFATHSRKGPVFQRGLRLGLIGSSPFSFAPIPVGKAPFFRGD